MSKHQIHGLTVEINVTQGNLTEQARGRCIGKVVNICREMPADEFRAAMWGITPSTFDGTPEHAALLEKLDASLASNYTKRYADDFAPIATLAVVGRAMTEHNYEG